MTEGTLFFSPSANLRARNAGHGGRHDDEDKVEAEEELEGTKVDEAGINRTRSIFS